MTDIIVTEPIAYNVVLTESISAWNLGNIGKIGGRTSMRELPRLDRRRLTLLRSKGVVRAMQRSLPKSVLGTFLVCVNLLLYDDSFCMSTLVCIFSSASESEV